MNEYKEKLLEYIDKNYDNVVKQTSDGAYIEIDLIPNSHNGLHDLEEIVEYCDDKKIDGLMFTRSYPIKVGDGIRMNRYVYYMCETAKQILIDLESYKKRNY